MNSVREMAETTPRRSLRLPHTHTPKMSERKKGLFQVDLESSRESLTKHRRLSVVDSESDSDDCDLGIISTLDSSSGEETDQNRKTPERMLWRGTRSHSKKFIESHDLKNFMKSPFTLKKYQTRHCPETRCGSLSTPATPHLQNHPGTPSSTHSCASVHTTSSTSSRARKSLASLIADTESCSSSLKDLNFDTDSGTDSKENTPTKSVRRSNRIHKLTPKFQSFKGILVEQKKNFTPMKTAVVCLTKMDMSSVISPTQMQKTPHNTSETKSPPKISHNRRSILEIQESPESTCDSEKSYKRLHNDVTDGGPTPKYPRLDPSTAPKARLSLFNCDRLKEILSAKSFYGKSNPDLNTSVTTKLANAIEATTYHRRPFAHSNTHRRKRKPGQINMGVKHKIRKPKIQKHKFSNIKGNPSLSKSSNSILNNSTISNVSTNKDESMLSHNSSQELLNMSEKADPFDREKQTIEALLSQWTEEEVPESELIGRSRSELPCFSSKVIEETSQIFQPVTAVPVTLQNVPQDTESVIIELGTPQNSTALESNSELKTQDSGQMAGNVVQVPQSSPSSDIMMVDSECHSSAHGDLPNNGHFLPVEGGYIFVDGAEVPNQEEIPDLDEIERELQMLDEQILKMAESNNINAEAVLASTETINPVEELTPATDLEKTAKTQKMFPIFSNPNSGIPTSNPSKEPEKEKRFLKTADDQYVIDAGQKKFGATQCKECGVIYQIGDPQDEHDHLVHHNASDVLRFNGWKEECVVDRTETARCIRVRGGEPGWKKVETLLSRVVHPSLGYDTTLPEKPHVYTAYLYIEKKKIIGCLVVEPKVRAYKLIPGDPDCCSVEDYPVKLGVSRIWTHAKHRRRGVATKLLQCARASALLGGALRPQELAFSAPTPSGKALATRFSDTPNFYVYL